MTQNERRRVYRSHRWRRLRLMVLERARRRCERCGGAGRLEVHHRRPMGAGGDPFDADNLEALCRRCHFAAEPYRQQQEARDVGRAWRAVIDGS